MNLKANLNKKSLIQVVVLVVILAVGGGLFLLQEDGGLDSVIGSVTGMFGAEPAAPAAAPAPQAAAGGAQRREKPAPAAPAEPAIPATPAKGQVRGKEFSLTGATIQSGVLTLRQGQDVEVSISRLSGSFDVPAGKQFRMPGKNAGETPVVRVTSRDEGGVVRNEEFADKYTLVLEFGKEKDRKLPGKLRLALPAAAKTQIAGTFEAGITGFRFIDGKADLGADASETLEYLTLREILKDDPDKPLKDKETVLRDIRLNTAPGQTPTGYLEATFRVGEAAPVTQRYQFVKDKDEWRVLRTLRTDQIDEAHPYKAPGAKEKPDAVFPHLAAKRLEAEASKRYPKKGIFVADFVTRHSDKHKLGDCTVTYRLEGNEQPLTKVYLFRLKANGWVLEQELGAKDKLNLDKGRVERRA